MYNHFLFLLLFLLRTHALICMSRCSMERINRSSTFADPSRAYLCRNYTTAEQCQARMEVHYDRIDVPAHISYALGSRGHIIESEMEDLVKARHLKSILYGLFVVASLDIDELDIVIYILCRTSDNCALQHVKNLFDRYHRQINPLRELRPLLYNANESFELRCYDRRSRTTFACAMHDKPACFFHGTEPHAQECRANEQTRVEYVLIMASPSPHTIEKKFELVVCTNDDCNGKDTIESVERIVYNTTWGIEWPLNRARCWTSVCNERIVWLTLLLFNLYSVHSNACL